MGFLIFTAKILLVLALGFLMFLPLVLEYRSYREDEENGLSYKRLRLAFVSLIYCAILTIIMTIVAEFFSWSGSLPFITWLLKKVTIPARLSYGTTIIAVIIINCAISFLFLALIGCVRARLAKKDIFKPKSNGELSRLQKIEKAVLRFFNDEKWFFAGTILKLLCIALFVVYFCIFCLFLFPVFFKTNNFIYRIAVKVFESGYLFPTLTLIPICEMWLFLAGVENLEKECPTFEAEEGSEVGSVSEDDIKSVDEGCQELFSDRFVKELDEAIIDDEISSTAYHPITNLIARDIEADSRHSKLIREGYLRCLNTIIENDIGAGSAMSERSVQDVIVNGSFFTDFSDYFLRYCTTILSRGDNILVVCNSNTQIEQAYQRVIQTLKEIYSLYPMRVVNDNVRFDNPVWKVVKIESGDSDNKSAEVNNCSVLIADPNFLTSKNFEQRCDTFIQLIDTVVVIDALGMVNSFARQMSIFDAKIKNIREQNATRARNGSNGFQIRYSNNRIKYICFDDSRIPGIDKVLKNLFYNDFISADAMCFSRNTIVCCYNYEGRANQDGEREQKRIARTNEDLGVLVGVANTAAKISRCKVSLFAEQDIPFRDLAESIDSNANHGIYVKNGVDLAINSYRSDPDAYRVIVAFDHNNNLPMAIRRYRTMASDKKTLVMIFSRPYMLRDYYQAKVGDLWESEQLMRIPVEESVKYNAIRKILVKADSGGISTDEMFGILEDSQLPDYSEFIGTRNVVHALKKIIEDCGKHPNEASRWNDYFEFVRYSSFNSNGSFVIEDRICLRNKRVFGVLLDSVSPANAVKDNKKYPLPIPKNRITQNYIVGQNLLYDGCVYVIDAIDIVKGSVSIRHATGGCNAEPYYYVQNREYHIDFSDTAPERTYPTKQVTLEESGEMAVKEATISVTKRPMEVITRGYSPVDQRTLNFSDVSDKKYFTLEGDSQIDKFKQTYRKYGAVNEPVCSSEMMMKSGVSYISSADGAQVMSVRLSGEFGEDNAKTVILTAVMLNEILHSMFPTVADSVVVCPVLNVDALKDGGSFDRVLNKIPKAYCRGYNADPKDIEFLIIEDCATDLGVISVLMSSGDDVLKLLFQPLYNYLNWYLNSEDHGDYLNFGMETVPDCFDFERLFKLASVLGNDKFVSTFVDIESTRKYEVCDFCGKRYSDKDDIVLLEDGRKMCKTCADLLVANDRKTLKSYLDRAKIFLESTYGITVDDSYEFCFESTAKITSGLKRSPDIIKRGSDIPLKSYVDDKNKVHVEQPIPAINLSEVLVRELTHVWQLKNLPDIDEELAEGHIALVAVQYLRFLNHRVLASTRAAYFETAKEISGTGYRRLVKALLDNPQFNNNPFLYLLKDSGKGLDDTIVLPPRNAIESGDYGLPYTPEKFDRDLDGKVKYFYYSRLIASEQEAYNTLFEAAFNHEEKVTVEQIASVNMQKVVDSIRRDHPELFWFNTWSSVGTEVTLVYCATAEESELLQKQMDEVVTKYLEGIDDSMSAYDVAVRIHAKVISAVDYDTIALEKQKQEGGPADDKIDYLRTICGVFLNGKAVCAGYARAVQYLLQKCGIECGMVAGHIRKETGEYDGAHAWNIVKIDGDYYYFDTTWDDCSDTVQEVKNTTLGFDYFCITTEELTRTRDIDLTPTDVPNCIAVRANFFYHNGCVLDAYDPNKIKTIAQNAAKNKHGSFAFKCRNASVFEQALSQISSNSADYYEALKAAAKIDKNIDTGGYRYSTRKMLFTITVFFKYK